MIVRIDSDEWFPCYQFVEGDRGVEADVPDDVVARWKAAQAEWDACQEQMGAVERWHGNWEHAQEAMARGDS